MADIILTSQFTLPGTQSFSDYVSYSFRKQALEQKKELSIDEQIELIKIEEALSRKLVAPGKTVKAHNGKLDLVQNEADALMNAEYEKYISYMSRKNALTDNMEQGSGLNGVFSMDNDVITKTGMIEIKEKIKTAQSKGSIFYQDVISFDQNFLIREKIYNPQTKELDEKCIRDASKKMMNKLFNDEQMKSGFWFASIHRNTNHVHVHFGAVEMVNTRPMFLNENGQWEPKGKRSMETINNMKHAFANTMIDRTAQLTRISELRNDLVKDIRSLIPQLKARKEEIKLLQEIKKELPGNRRDWLYGSKYITAGTREKIDTLVTGLLKRNPKYKDYLKVVKEESKYRDQLYGKSKDLTKSFEKGHLQDIKKRMGNAFLKKLKKEFPLIETSEKIDIHDNFIMHMEPKVNFGDVILVNDINSKTFDQKLNDILKQNIGINNQKINLKEDYIPLYTKYQDMADENMLSNVMAEPKGKSIAESNNIRFLNQAKRILDNEWEMYMAEQEHETIQRKINYQQSINIK